ncbi:flagellar biosynthetic protein FliO [Microbacterium sp. APC 3901]|uniref:flagellar biosynthetic protein FliO n=1 Tax=Microbacterium sp. APC 3901 TaxID=3035192 RepID=UPI0025B55EF8|nr:flagellar biosynthetic protein FliO [Microbacterium sp. APC 3901]MDN3443819.1 flagellar biosynthetic protein FliO [Microbacterium sp. APC 3901]
MDDILVALRAIVALGAVLGLLLFLSRRLQKSQAKGVSPLAGLMPKRLAKLSELVPSRPVTAPRARPEKITVVARSGIGGKAQLVVAEFGGIRYVLGVTEHGINVVDTQEAPALAEEIPAEEERSVVSETPDDIVDRALRSVA